MLRYTKMKIYITQKLMIGPLVLLIIMAPVLCCCFEGKAEANAKTSLTTPQQHTQHCHSKTEEPAKDHESKNCDCPHFLADANKASFKMLNQSNHLLNSDSIINLINHSTLKSYHFSRLSKLHANHIDRHQQDSPPIFIINHSFRI